MVPHDARFGQGGVLDAHFVVNVVQPLIALLLKGIVRNGVKGGAGHRHVAGIGGKFQIALLFGEPAQEHGGGFGFLVGGLEGAQANTGLRHQGRGGACGVGQGSQQQVGGLGGVVRVGDEIIVIKDGRRAAKARQRLAGHHLRVGVQVRDQNIALHQRPGKLHPRSAEGLVGQIVPAALVQLCAALFQRVQLHQTQGVVQRAEGLALRPLPVGTRHFKKAVPCGKGGKLRPGVRRKPGVLGAVQKDELGGFGHREHHLPPVNDAVLHKAGHIGRHVLGGEPVVPVHKVLNAQTAGIRGVGREQVRQVQRAGLAGLGVLQLAADGGAVGHVGHVEQDALLPAHRVVELGQQAVHGRVGLFAVHMPDAEHGGVLGREQGLAAAAARKCQTGDERRKL